LVFNIVCWYSDLVKVTVTSIISLLPEVTRSVGNDSDSDVMMVARKTVFTAEVALIRMFCRKLR
jgi:hypothetical protein